MPVNNEKGFVDPLLTNVAIDYSVKAKEGLVADKIMPILGVSKPAGTFFKYSKEQSYKMTDDTFSESGEAKELKRHGEKVAYACTSRGNKTFIDKDEERFKEGPFVRAELDFVKDIVLNIERNREIRVRDKILNLSGRSVSLTGTGSAKTNKWLSNGGDPFTAIQDALKACFYRPNIMMLTEPVFDALEYHSILLEKLGEANMIKKINEETLAKLFRVNEIIIASGKGDNSKFKKDGSVNPQLFWGNNVVFGYFDSRKDVPCSGKTFVVKYAESDGNGYVVRKWEEPKKGILGGSEIQVGCSMEEYIISEDLIYSIQDVL